MKTYKPAIGDIVHCVFFDHCENFHDVMQFEVFGRITAITKRAYIISAWQYADPLQRAADRSSDENENKFAIVKKAVDSIKKLK